MSFSSEYPELKFVPLLLAKEDNGTSKTLCGIDDALPTLYCSPLLIHRHEVGVTFIAKDLDCI